MGVQNPANVELSLYTNPLNGKANSVYVKPSPINSFKTASEYTPVTSPFSLKMNTLLSTSGNDAYHKWASSFFQYKAYVGFTGGRPPYRITLLDAPNGATIGASGLEQTWNRALDVIGGGVYNFTVPTNNATILWTPTIGNIGSTFKFKVLIEDTTGQQITNTHYVTVDDTKFIFVDGSVVDDSGLGTWSSPKKTFNAAHTNAGKICVYKTAGTYAVTFGGLNNSDNRSKTHIALVDNVIFDMTTEQFGCGSSATDIAFVNITFTGSKNTETNCRVFNLNGKVDRIIWWGCKWRSVGVGTSGTDNPSCIFFGNISAPISNTAINLPDTHAHTNITIVNCDVDSTVNCQQVAFFSSKYIKVEGCTATLPSSPVASNGALWINLKDSCVRAFVQRNITLSGSHASYTIAALNQQGWLCDTIEVSYNIISHTNVPAVSFNNQSTVAGNTGNGQRVAAINQRCIRNTFIANSNESPINIVRWSVVAGIEPTIVEGNICATTATNIISTSSSNNDGYTLVGLNPKINISGNLDSNGHLLGSSRTTYLGKQGAEIASTEVA